MMLDTSRVTQVYSGRQGCACGCRGNYSDKPQRIRQVAAKMAALVANGEATEVIYGAGIYCAVDYETPGGEAKTLTAYFDEPA